MIVSFDDIKGKINVLLAAMSSSDSEKRTSTAKKLFEIASAMLEDPIDIDGWIPYWESIRDRSKQCLTF